MFTPPLTPIAERPTSNGIIYIFVLFLRGCLTCWCPCVTFGRNAEIVDKAKFSTKLRQHYGIKNGACPDCLIHCFCQPCALCQEYHELQFQGFDVST
ncbi:cell number regulator 10-like, partial [Coffea eugenioides]|uniref:cell number regulator 10-like n=1 Tax=Coffea eugenioides TaxID=49369 RepID=UPI000F6157AB